MRAGDLDRRIELRRRVLTRQNAGEEVVSYATAPYATVWGRRLDLTGREYFAAQQVNAEATARFRIRYRSDVLLTDRLTCEGRDYNISQASEIGRREALELIGSAVVS